MESLIEFASEDMRNNKKIVTEAINYDGRSLEYIYLKD